MISFEREQIAKNKEKKTFFIKIKKKPKKSSWHIKQDLYYNGYDSTTKISCV